MLKVRLMGGLGNQMFQYAFARAFQLNNNVEVMLDVTFLNDKTKRENFTLRDFELNTLQIQLQTISDDPAIQRGPIYKLKHKIIQRLIPSKFIMEVGLPYNPTYLNKKTAELAIGYFQSEKYFLDIRSTLLKDFDFTKSITDKNQELAREIRSCRSISLHVRRGDYVSQVVNQDVIRACDINYYNKSVSEIEQRFTQPVFYIFSDDIPWAKEHLRINSKTRFIDHNQGKNSYQDMFLMSQCQHNIIANSSFSWWGAWLNQNQNKIIIAPAVWFNSPAMDARDIYCTGWLRF